MALVHASPESPWRSPAQTASDAELESVYGPLGRPVAVYGHIHVPFIRSISEMTIVNTGSVSLSFDGDPRAAYLLLDDDKPAIRRVEYDVDREIKASPLRLPSLPIGLGEDPRQRQPSNAVVTRPRSRAAFTIYQLGVQYFISTLIRWISDVPTFSIEWGGNDSIN